MCGRVGWGRGGGGSISLVPTPRTPPHERVLGMRHIGGYILVFMLYFLPIYMYKAHSISHLYIHWMSI